MGYTHYWTQRRGFTVAQWQEFITDLQVILDHAKHESGIALANGAGEGGTAPEIRDDHVFLNGLGEDSHETLAIWRKVPEPEAWQTRGSDFCKTARKPYDLVVTAVLAYLSTVTRKEDPATHEPIIGSEQYTVTSDGFGSDWLAGVDLVRKALPRVANVIDIPMEVMKSDRWCAPWVSGRNDQIGYEVRFCIDGHGYVMRTKTGESYRFETHGDLAQWLRKHQQHGHPGGRTTFTNWGSYSSFEPNIWDATGTFDKARHDRIARAQRRACHTLFPVPMEHAYQPPAYVRPGEMPENAGREFCYSVNDLLNLLEKT